MSVSSVGSSNPCSYLQRTLQDSSDPSQASAPSDPLQALFQAVSGGGNSGDPLLAAIGSGDSGSGSSSSPFSPDMMQALFSVQGDQSSAGPSTLQSLFNQFDANGDGQISQSEFEKAIGPGVDQSKVDALFAKLDGNGDGSIDEDEMQSAVQKAHGHHHHHHGGAQGVSGSNGASDPLQSLLSGASADGTTSQTASNADGSSTTTITYADGTTVEMTSPATSADAGSSNPQAPSLANVLKQLIALQAQFAPPTTSLTV